mmetsp:Transcript_64501/g.74068  ORF Transcript_64501/g.74068 Transcript_64501/m.74068 type:complete len:170 (-) Transcript_64501:175-684(-)
MEPSYTNIYRDRAHRILVKKSRLGVTSYVVDVNYLPHPRHKRIVREKSSRLEKIMPHMQQLLRCGQGIGAGSEETDFSLEQIRRSQQALLSQNFWLHDMEPDRLQWLQGEIEDLFSVLKDYKRRLSRGYGDLNEMNKRLIGIAKEKNIPLPIVNKTTVEEYSRRVANPY